MKTFLQRHGEQILGVLSGFDRLRFRGTLRPLSYVAGLLAHLSRVGVLLTGFAGHAEQVTKRLRRELEARATAAGRPVQYLPGVTDKEALVAKIRRDQGAAKDGTVAVLSTLEGCVSYDIYRNRATCQLDLRRGPRKCLHYYFYVEDSMFGLVQVRLQTWFPFGVHVVLNGREWLARQLDAARIGYVRRDNCFAAIADFARAQKLADRQPRIDWPKHLDRLVRRVCPRPAAWLGERLDYYWTIEQSEWATDIAFRSAQALGPLYQTLLRRGMETFGSRDVLRFLGRKVPASGGVYAQFAGEVTSELKQRPEGIRLKHRVGRNTLKMYDKQGTVLRIETTLNEVRGLKVFRRKETPEPHAGHMPEAAPAAPPVKPAAAPPVKPAAASASPPGKPEVAPASPPGKPQVAPRQWLPLRKSVADMSRRARLSQSANRRYLEALGAIDGETPLSLVADAVCQPVVCGKRRYRALNPLAPQDARLLELVSRGEYQITGLRNRDLRQAWYGETTEAAQRRKQASAISRKLSLLRAHGLIQKVPHTHRYLLTKTGVTAIAALLAARNANVNQLTPAA
jgi:hypothetical protein